MKKILSTALVAALAFQFVAVKSFADDRVSNVIQMSAAERSAQVERLKAQIAQSQLNLTKLQKELDEAKDRAPLTYKSGVVIRNGSLVVAALGLVTLGTGYFTFTHGSNEEGARMGESLIVLAGTLITVAGGIGAAAGQGMVSLTAPQVHLVESEIQVASAKLKDMQAQLAKIS